MTGTPHPSQPRQRNPRGHGERLHSELLDAAVRVLAAHGDTERLSIRAVAAEAQVSPPAVYRHFPDRRTLVRTVVHGMTDLRASKPESPWPGTDEMIVHLLVSLGLRATRRTRD